MKKNRLIWVIVILGLTIAVVLYIRSKHKKEVDNALLDLKTEERANPCEKQCKQGKMIAGGFLGIGGSLLMRHCYQCLKHNNLL